jgi:polyisoprenoid-binding protein YceI
MSKRFLTGLVAAAMLGMGALGVAGVGAYGALQPAAAASAPIQAVPLQTQNQTTPATGAVADTADDGAVPPAATGSAASAPAAATTTFTIQQSGSKASFSIGEILNGSPFTAVGTTDQVAGQIAVDPTNPSAAQVGVIQIDARAFKTDSSLRDRAIQSFILQTDKYPTITFAPTALRGLPTSGQVGQTYSFQIDGNLTVHGVTKPVTFEATITPVSASQIKGSATATIHYADYGISIPKVPVVGGVDETVNLQLDFVATA